MILNRYNLHPDFVISAPAIIRITNLVLREEQQTSESISFIFTDDETLAKMKKEYFLRQEFTDTISFNLNEPGEPIEGEVYISMDRIVENAGIYQSQLREELARVIIHSLLHLCGYNDEKTHEKELMRRKEDRYIEQCDLGYLVRKKR